MTTTNKQPSLHCIPLKRFVSNPIKSTHCHMVFLFLLILFLYTWEETIAQPYHNNNQGRKQQRKIRDKDYRKSDGKLFKALQVLYPLHFFNPTLLMNDRNWRSPGEYNEILAQTSQTTKEYLKIGHSQDQEDIWLYENWFFGIQHGIILESGALDGIIFSNSYLFEQFANWTAIHVEADPENFFKLKRQRSNAININGALCSEPKLLHYSSLGVIPVRGFIEFMSESFIKKWHGKIYNNKTSIDELPTVQCLPMKLLLRELNIKHIDIWILDVEGAEESVLKGTDFNEVHINAVAMECDEHDIVKNERKTSILEKNNFQCQLVERNCMCKHNDYKPSSANYRSSLKKWDGQKWSKTYIKGEEK